MAQESKLSDGWCDCPSDVGFDDTFYIPDRLCWCGIEKHHWHCATCRGVVQIG